MGMLAVPVAAQREASREDFTLTPSGEAYLESIARRGIEARVGYWDPSAAAPPLSLDPDLLDEEQDEEDESSFAGSTLGNIVGVIALMVLIACFAAVFLLIGPRNVALTSTGSATRNTLRRRTATSTVEELPPSLELAVGEPDRRRALAILAEAAVIEAARQHNQRLGRAMTMRDALRRIPRDWAGYAPLATLTRAAEMAHFGGRPVSEEGFAEHLAFARSLFGPTPAGTGYPA